MKSLTLAAYVNCHANSASSERCVRFACVDFGYADRVAADESVCAYVNADTPPLSKFMRKNKIYLHTRRNMCILLLEVLPDCDCRCIERRSNLDEGGDSVSWAHAAVVACYQ
jgi:hypothetical protein